MEIRQTVDPSARLMSGWAAFRELQIAGPSASHPSSRFSILTFAPPARRAVLHRVRLAAGAGPAIAPGLKEGREPSPAFAWQARQHLQKIVRV